MQVRLCGERLSGDADFYEVVLNCSPVPFGRMPRKRDCYAVGCNLGVTSRNSRWFQCRLLACPEGGMPYLGHTPFRFVGALELSCSSGGSCARLLPLLGTQQHHRPNRLAAGDCLASCLVHLTGTFHGIHNRMDGKAASAMNDPNPHRCPASKMKLRYVMKILSAKDRTMVREHLRVCRSCRAEVKILRKAMQTHYEENRNKVRRLPKIDHLN
jgi:hypothetical protein